MATEPRPARRVAAALLAFALALRAPGAGRARADETDAHQQADDPSVSSFDLRLGWFEQDGHGFQSQTQPSGKPGSERATIVQPMALFRIRQGKHVQHTLVIPVDIVTAASPDALDAISSASQRNEAAGIDMTTAIAACVNDFVIRWGVHVEEPLRAGNWGAAWTRHLAEDNATVTLSGNASFDYFDNISQEGYTDEQRSRVAANANLGASQILSPTTLVDGSYGITYQVGVLEQTWNAVPRGPMRVPLGEKFPHQRTRHALFGRVAQMVPLTHTTLKLAYRYYVDDFGLSAHTVELRAYQYLSRWLVVRGSWRFHTQTGVDFYTENAVNLMTGPLTPRTADSDLGPFDADELGVKLMLLPRRAPWPWLRPHSFALSYERYTRDNGLSMDVLALEWGQEL